MHHVQGIKNKLRGDNENAFFLYYYLLLEFLMIVIMKKQVALWYLSHLEIGYWENKPESNDKGKSE